MCAISCAPRRRAINRSGWSSVTIESGGAAFAQQKAEVDGVVRRSLIVTPRAERGTVRVLVSMDIEGTRSFGVFSIPIHLER